MSTAHELGHNLYNVFPPADMWGAAVYGSSWSSAYAGEGAANAVLQGQFGYGRPADFATTYGWSGGPKEDQAEVFGAMLANYPAMQDAASQSPLLALKMRMVQDSFYAATGGVMDQTYWNSMRVLDSNYFLPPRDTNFFQKIAKWVGGQQASRK